MPTTSSTRGYRRALAAVLLTLGLVLPALVATPVQAASGSITGLVSSKIGGTVAPLAGANLHLAKYRSNSDFFTDPVGSATTDARGRYTFSGLANGTYELRIYPPGTLQPGGLGYEYYPNRWSPYDSEQIKVSGSKVTLADTVLEQTGWITGRVTDSAGQPIAGTSIGLRDDNPRAGGYGFRTDADGTFDSRTGEWTKNLIPGTYVLEASAWGDDIEGPVYASQEVRVPVSPARGTALPTIVLDRRPTVVFTVTDTDGRPLVGAPIELFVQQGGKGAFEPAQYGPNETDQDGRYRFVGGSASYKFRVHPPKGYTGTGVAEYWDGGSGAYAFQDAAVVAFDDVPVKRNHTIQLGPAPVIKPAVPQVSGTPAVGNVVTAKTGSWTPSGVGLSYEWLKNGVVIPGATKRSLRITSGIAQGMESLSVRVTGGLTGEKAVDSTSAVRKPAVKGAKPKVTGKAEVGRKLTVKPGAWKPAKVTLKYQWLRNGKKIRTKAATKKVYRLTSKDRGKRISVKVTGSRAGWTPAAKVSAKTRKVTR